MKIIPILIMAASFLSAPACLAEPDAVYDLISVGGKMNAGQAAEMETLIASNPDDLATRTKLLGYYFMAGRKPGDARDRRRTHVRWMIQNHPDSDLVALPYCEMDGFSDPEGYVEAKKLWLEQTEVPTPNPKVLGNAGAFFMLQDPGLAEDFLKRAQKAEPDNLQWADKLGHLYSMSDDKDAAAKSLEQLEHAQASDKEKMSRFYRLSELAKAAFKAADPKKAARYAKESIADAENYPNDWNYGNSINRGNNVLGLCALQQGDAKLAAEFLVKAGKTTGSPQLNSFGPNMLLARELLKTNEGKEAVLEYFECCRKFWKMGGDRLDQWTKEVEAGNIPEFGGNLRY